MEFMPDISDDFFDVLLAIESSPDLKQLFIAALTEGSLTEKAHLHHLMLEIQKLSPPEIVLKFLFRLQSPLIAQATLDYLLKRP